MGLRGPTKDNLVRRQKNLKPNHPEIRPIKAPRATKVPDPPKSLSIIAGIEWQRAAKELYRSGLLPDIDLSALEHYCQLYSMNYEAQQDIKKRGAMIGNRQNPNVKTSIRISAMMIRLRETLGMTAMSRARLTGRVAPPEPVDNLNDFLAGRTEEFNDVGVNGGTPDLE